MIRLSPTYCTRAQLLTYMKGRKQAREDMHHARSMQLRIAARDAFNVFSARVTIELENHARMRYTPMPMHIRNVVSPYARNQCDAINTN